MKKIPYGISSFDKIKSENYYFFDKTKCIEMIEEMALVRSFPLNNLTNLYDVISEKGKNKGYADICLEPDRRFTQYVKFDYIIELKYKKAEEIETPAKEKLTVSLAVKTAATKLQQYAANNKFQTTQIIIVASAKKLIYMDCLSM